MSGEDAIRRCAITLLDFGYEFGLDEVEKFIRAAAGWEWHHCPVVILDIRVSRRQISVTVRVAYTHHDYRRHAIVGHQEVDGAADLVDLLGRVGLVQYRIHILVALIACWRAHPDDAIFVQHLGVNLQSLRDGRRQVLGNRRNNRGPATEHRKKRDPALHCRTSIRSCRNSLTEATDVSPKGEQARRVVNAAANSPAIAKFPGTA